MKRIDLHLAELKWRCISFLMAFFFTILAFYIYSSSFLSILLKPLYNKENLHFIFTNISEAFRTNLNISIILSFGILIPFVFYHIFCFFAPGFYKKDRNEYLFIFHSFFFFFLVGGFIGWKFFFPMFWEFFYNFELDSLSFTLKLEPRISSNIEFILFIILGSQCLFVLFFWYVLVLVYYPVILFKIFILYLDSKNGELVPRSLLYFFFFLVASLISPPDIAIQLTVSLSFVFVFELCFFFNLVALGYHKTKEGNSPYVS
jgi:Sec-independent protein secretion pathway component TatC